MKSNDSISYRITIEWQGPLESVGPILGLTIFQVLHTATAPQNSASWLPSVWVCSKMVEDQQLSKISNSWTHLQLIQYMICNSFRGTWWLPWVSRPMAAMGQLQGWTLRDPLASQKATGSESSDVDSLLWKQGNFHGEPPSWWMISSHFHQHGHYHGNIPDKAMYETIPFRRYRCVWKWGFSVYHGIPWYITKPHNFHRENDGLPGVDQGFEMILGCQSFRESQWRFPEIGVPPVTIQIRLGFSMK